MHFSLNTISSIASLLLAFSSLFYLSVLPHARNLNSFRRLKGRAPLARRQGRLLQGAEQVCTKGRIKTAIPMV